MSTGWRRRERAVAVYAAELGEAALERQLQERAERHPCCGEREADGHHFMCSKRPPDEPVAHVDGQETLL